MYATLTSVQLYPGKRDEFLAWYPEAVASLKQAGFSTEVKKVYALTDGEKMMMVVMYASKAAADRVQASDDYKQTLSSGAHLIDFNTIVRQGEYEVSLEL